MSLTKSAMPYLAILAIAIITVPNFAYAATYDTVQKTIDLQIDSANQSEYDDMVNLGEPERAITNIDTWMPAPQGVWLGASTEESLFQFNQVLPETNTFDLYTEVKFNSSQIMNGASITIIRSPIHSNGVISQELTVHRLLTPGWDVDEAPPAFLFDADFVTIASISINMSDASITSGEDCWTVGNRTYIKLHAPLYSGVSYVFMWHATYAMDSRPAIYISGQDIANDNITNTKVCIKREITPVDSDYFVYEWNIDPGISYDMLNGLGNALYAEEVYVRVGDYLTWETSAPERPDAGDYFHTLMLPFVTDDHTLNASLRFTKANVGETLVWEEDRYEWFDYILACSDTALGLIEGGRYCRFNLTFNENKTVTFMFIDSPEADYLDNQATFTLSGVRHTVFARPWASNQLSVGEVSAPSLNPSDFPALVNVQENEQQTWYGTIVGMIMIVAGSLLIATGVGIPFGIALMAGGMGMIILEDIAHDMGYSGLGDLVAGTFQNLVDAIWPILKGIGEFLWSVGEFIWEALNWIVDAIIEYGAVLLGLLIVGVAMLLYFYPLRYTIKIFASFLLMAQGRLEAAADKGYSTSTDIVTDFTKPAKKVAKWGTGRFSSWYNSRGKN